MFEVGDNGVGCGAVITNILECVNVYQALQNCTVMLEWVNVYLTTSKLHRHTRVEFT